MDGPADVPENEKQRCEFCGTGMADGAARFLPPNPYDDLIVPGFNWALEPRFPAVCEACYHESMK